MTHCNYIPLDLTHLDVLHPFLDDFLDLDVLASEEGLLINVPEEE